MKSASAASSKEARSVLSAIIGNAIWGFAFVFTKAALNAPYANKYNLLANRFIAATVIMLIILLVKGQKLSFKGKHLGWLVGLVVTSTLYFFFETWAIDVTNSTFTGVALAVVPVFSIATGWIFLKERPGWLQALLCLVPIAGVILITISGEKMGVIPPIGVLMVILTCISSAFYKTCNRFLSAEFTASERNFAILAVKAVVFFIMALVDSHFDVKAVFMPWSTPDFVLPLLGIVVLSSVIANILVSYAAGYMSVMRLATFGAVSTLCSAFGGIVLQHDPYDFMMISGAALVIIGIFFVTKCGNREKLTIKPKE